MACLNPEDIQTKRVFDTNGVFPTFQAHRGGGESGAILSTIKKCVRRVADGRLADCSACCREVTGGTDGSAAVGISKSTKEQQSI